MLIIIMVVILQTLPLPIDHLLPWQAHSLQSATLITSLIHTTDNIFHYNTALLAADISPSRHILMFITSQLEHSHIYVFKEVHTLFHQINEMNE